MQHPAPLFSDTSPEAEAFLLQQLRHMPGWRKLEMMAQLNAQMRAVALAGIRHRHPNSGPAELHRRLADILLGPELAQKAYGPLAAAIAGDKQAQNSEDAAQI